MFMIKSLFPLTVATVLLTSFASLTYTKAAVADDDAKINARIETWGQNCKNEVASRLGSDVSMADINVELGATLRTSIDSGEMTLDDINQSGLIYNWSVPKEKVAGYCGTDGNGTVTDFQFN